MRLSIFQHILSGRIVMRLVVGGVRQGKTAFARTLSEDVCDNVHLMVRDWMQSGEDPHEQVLQIVKTYADGVVTVAEVGCGPVPADAFEREYREMVGRISCELAAQAEAVYRVTCGIAMRIK